MNLKTIFSRCLFFLATFSLFNPFIYGIENTDSQVLMQLKGAEPELFQRVRLVEERDRELLEVTLSDVLKMVQKRSITIEAERMSIKAARAGVEAAQGMYQSALTASASQAKTTGLGSTNLSDDTALTNYMTTSSTNSTTLSTTWSKRNSLGITFSSTLQNTTSQSKVYYQADQGDEITGGSATDDPLDTTVLSASVSVPVFQDWGDVNDIPIRRTELAVEQSRVTTRSTEMSLLEAVARTYWSLVGIRENINTLQDAVKVSEMLVRETKARVEVGVLNPTDLQEAETQLASNQKNLLTRKIEEQEIEDQIKAALNLGQIPYGFKPADIPSIHGEDFDFQELLRKTFENSAALKKLKLALKSNQYDLDEALNSDKTNLDLSLTYKLSGYGASTSESLGKFTNPEYQGYQLSLTWAVPLFDKATPETIKKRRIERNKLELQIRDTESQLYTKLQTILRNLKFGLAEKRTVDLSVKLAKDLLEKEIEKLKIGKSTSFNVSQAQQKYTDAKGSETLVRVKNEQTFVSLLALTGDIYEYYGLPESI